MKIVTRKPPLPRVKRMTEALKATPVSKTEAVQLDIPTARAFRMYAWSRGWVVIQQTQADGSILFWRVG